ncbi:MAG: rod shape-determining protein MreC [Flavobacteriaceae bacterium]
MQWVFNAIFRYKNFLLYLFLVGVSLFFSGTQSGYHQSRLAKATLFMSGSLHKPFNTLGTYFNLADQNQRLIEENNTLKNLVLERFNQSEMLALEEENMAGPNYWSLPAKVIRNSFTQTRNILLIDKGSVDNIVKEMGVIGSKGIVGIVNQTSGNFASVLSILYQDLKINAKFKNSNVFGSLFWNGKSPNKMQLADISVINPVALGDTIVTGGMSSYFPEGIPIGTVTDFELPENGGYYNISIELINNMTDLDYVYVIGNKNRAEIINLLDSNK